MPPFLCCMTLFSFVTVGQEAIASAPNIKEQLQGLIQVVVSQGNIAIFYTGLSAVFATLDGHEQIVFVALLLLIKLLFKNAVASVSPFLEEYVSGIVVFLAELVHALFAATCMQTARSPLA
ncbi:hypothetical protein ON010_g17828 [Phytophthora cinnamomi]|nr:hypothetical protein ON010_g17828 [Phytophthora cinnamomi]